MFRGIFFLHHFIPPGVGAAKIEEPGAGAAKNGRLHNTGGGGSVGIHTPAAATQLYSDRLHAASF